MKNETVSSSPRWFVPMLAISCGTIVANLYYSQAIVSSIGTGIGLTASQSGLMVALTQAGYALGLLLLVPLADLMENRRLVQLVMIASAFCLLAAGLVHNPISFLIISFLIGITTVSGQIIIPLATFMTPPASHGKLVGNIMAGLLLGILLARPLASLMTQHFGWRSIFLLAAVLMLAVNYSLASVLPKHVPQNSSNYFSLIKSLLAIWNQFSDLRHRSFYQACLFACFSLYWTAVPIILYTELGMSHTDIAQFAMIGIAGVVAAPIAGRMADAGYTHTATVIALCLTVLVFIAGLIFSSHLAVLLAIVGLLINFTVQMHLVIGQRIIYALAPENRGRLNALYMTCTFIGGAVGSLLAVNLVAAGWSAISSVGAVLAGTPMLFHFWHYFNRDGITQHG